jgi:hypothetical protein
VKLCRCAGLPTNDTLLVAHASGWFFVRPATVAKPRAVEIVSFNGKPKASALFVADAFGLPLNDERNCAILIRERHKPQCRALS